MHSSRASSDAQTVALLGHDLRAALSEVIGGLRLIDVELLAPELRDLIARTRAGSESLALLLEQALALLLDAPPDKLAPAQSVQTQPFLDNLHLRWNARAQEHGLSFHLDAKGLPAHLALDPALLERVLSNLLNNALKYADTGRISCKLRTTPDHILRINVQDQGKGFSPGTLARLYTCNNRDESASTPGSGMGLHIVWDIVEQAGGQIAVGNHSEGGAEVAVQLPLRPQPPTAKLQQTLLRGRHLLIADDSETSRLLLTQMLSDQGAQITAVADGAQAITQLHQGKFDALIVDIEMPQMNGLEVISHIRSQPGPLARLPILAITAYQLRANKAAILVAGADGLLCKPVLDAQGLSEVLLQVLRRNVIPAHTAQQIEPDQFEKLLQMAGPQVAAELLDRLQKDLRATERGLVAASHGPDWPAVRRQTHVMIALAGTAGASFLHQLAQAMNDLASQAVPDRGTFHTLLPQALEQLDMLIHFIDQKIPSPTNPEEQR
ncbi:MAG: response regulator [Cypionkella sp.]|uniref:hybrid sensor histidine kinase/response regulator n=1 Tax=Cypionkella sp. TaxID=2811411 RepID=UPI002AB8072D|nr:response regulator [Cypionkella sp.]MDZ4311453.1 response regulator [Cypionkella sp.]MDZ4394278.1 response regulator [Cypionkella sp.]